MTAAPALSRPGRTIAVAVSAFLLSALGAAGLAHPGSAQASATAEPTRLDVRWGDTTPVAGAKVLVYGFAFPGQDGRVLRVQTPAGSSGAWHTVGSVQTLSNGSFTVYLQHTVRGSHRYRVLAPGTSTAAAAVSPPTTFVVSRRSTTVTSRLSAPAVARGGIVTLRGTVGPDFTARTVTLQGRRHRGHTWSALGEVGLDDSRRYSLPVRTRTAGSWDYRATVSATPYARPGTSPVRTLRVTG